MRCDCRLWLPQRGLVGNFVVPWFPGSTTFNRRWCLFHVAHCLLHWIRSLPHHVSKSSKNVFLRSLFNWALQNLISMSVGSPWSTVSWRWCQLCRFKAACLRSPSNNDGSGLTDMVQFGFRWNCPPKHCSEWHSYSTESSGGGGGACVHTSTLCCALEPWGYVSTEPRVEKMNKFLLNDVR